MRRFRRYIRSFWEHDPGLSAILVLLILFVFVLPPTVAPLGERAPLVELAFSLLLFLGVLGLKVPAAVRGLLLVLAVAATLVRWLASSNEIAVSAASLASIALLATVVLAQTFRAGPVTSHRIQGAIAAYLLLGIGWAYAYELVEAAAPGAFTSARAVVDRGWQYFSFVTLTTIGYGDVTPVHPAARSLAMLEALTGQLYPAILLARLVSLQVLPASDEPSQGV
jgi:hypothetical protein